jgi:hypothetical protein
MVGFEVPTPQTMLSIICQRMAMYISKKLCHLQGEGVNQVRSHLKGSSRSDHVDGASMFLRNIVEPLLDYRTLPPRICDIFY